MVLSDMKKLGHQCCLFIVINLATCFASAAGKLVWTPSHCRLPSPTCYIFIKQALTENQTIQGQILIQISWKGQWRLSGFTPMSSVVLSHMKSKQICLFVA